MMLAKPKPEPTDTEDQQDNAEAYSPNDVGVDEEDVDTDDREAEIARRLALLSPPEPEEEKVAPPPALVDEDDAVSDFLNTTDIDRDDAGSKPVPVADVEKDLLAPVSLPPVAGVVQQPPVPAPAAVVVQKPQPAPVKVSAPVPVPAAAPAEKAKPNNKSALLARIMAAQERAKNAQLKQASSAAPAAPTSVEFEKEKMMRALNGITSETVQKKAEPLPVIHTNKFAPPPAPMAFSAPPMAQAMAPPAAKAPQPPPPSFDIFEKQMSQMNIQPPAAPAISAPSAPFATAPVAMAPPPPAFDAIAPQIFQQQPVAPPPSTFSASDVDLLGGNFGGVMPVAPPSVSAPSFDQVMQQNLVGDPYGQSPEEIDFELDENGMKLSPEEKQRMVEEQRAIMEQIARQKRENKASEAAIKADAFANRMTGASGGGQVIPLPPPAMGVDGFSASEVEEQRKILEQLEAAKRGSGGTSQSRNVTNTTSSSASVNTGTGFSASDIEEQRRILEQIEAANGGGQSAAPVSTEFMTREEVMQMEEDRKMAEMLQAQENAAAAEDGDTASGYATAGRSAASTLGSSDDKSSWWGTLNDALVSVGMVSPEEKDPSEMSVSRPPGSGPRMLHSAVTGEERREQVGLLDDYGYGGGDGRPAARMAQPTTNLFSCVVDSVSNTAATAGSYLVGDEDSDEEVHGVDSTSFLSVPNVGRDKSNGGGGNYFAIPPNE